MRRCHPYAMQENTQKVAKLLVSIGTQLALRLAEHLTALRKAWCNQAMSAWSGKPRRAPRPGIVGMMRGSMTVRLRSCMAMSMFPAVVNALARQAGQLHMRTSVEPREMNI